MMRRPNKRRRDRMSMGRKETKRRSRKIWGSGVLYSPQKNLTGSVRTVLYTSQLIKNLNK